MQWRNAEAAEICPGRSAVSLRERYKVMRKKMGGVKLGDIEDDSNEVFEQSRLTSARKTPSKGKASPASAQREPNEDKRTPKMAKVAAKAEEPFDEQADAQARAAKLVEDFVRISRVTGVPVVDVVAAFKEMGDLTAVEVKLRKKQQQSKAYEAIL